MKAYLLLLLRRAIGERLAIAALLITSGILLTGCSSTPKLNHSPTINQPTLLGRLLPDYLSAQCINFWQQENSDTLENPLYWLRGIECARQLSPAEARAEARQRPTLTWQDTFKRGILLSTARVTPVERRRYIVQMDMLATDIPPQIQPLFIIWLDGQRAQLNLTEERNRYSKLQQSTDSQLDEFRRVQQFLRSELEMTTHKLETLSEIERQLSSRKPGNTYSQEMQSPYTEENNIPLSEEEQP